MDVDNEIVCYTDRWEQTISSDSCDDESDVGSAGGHGGNFIKHKEHTFSRTAIRSVVGHRRESLFQFHDSEVADNVCETVYVDRLEHILALDAEVLSNRSVIVNNMLSEDTDNIFSYDTSSDISQLLHESRVGAEKWSDGREENIDEHIERGTTKLQHYDFLDLGLSKTLSLHYTERWERTEVKDDFPVSQKIKMSKLFHPWKSLIIESISTALDAGNNIMKGSVKDELTMNKEGISSKTVVPEVNWSSDVQFHDHTIQEARVSCQKLNITEENNSFPNTKAVCDYYVNTNSTLGLQLERREHISVPDVTTVFVEMASIRDNISMNDIDNTQSVEETTHGIHDLSISGLSGAVTYYIDRWERTEHVQDLTDNHIIVSRGNHPWEASRKPSSIISIHNYDTNKLKGIHDERLHHSVNNQEVIPLTGPPVVTHGNDKSSNTTLMSTRHFQKRKIIEVNKNDFSGVEVRHTSYLNITIGSQSREHLLTSELNTALLETMDTDIIISPRENETFCNSEFPVNLPLAMSKEETIDRWNYDTSSNSMACDSHERFVETGDCVFASDSNDSCLEDSLRCMGFTALVKNCSDVPKIILKPGTADTEIAFLNDTDLCYRQLGNLEEIRQKQTSDRQFCGTVNQTACSKTFNDSENIDLHGDQHRINIEYGHEGYARKDEKEDDDNLKIENTGQNSTGSCINEDTEYVTETDSESSGIHDNTEHVLKKKVDDTKYVIGNDSKHTKIHSEYLVKQREDNTEYFAHNNDGDCRRDHGTQCFIKERSEFTVYAICSTLEHSRRDNKTERVINQKVVDTKHIMMNDNEDSRKDDTGHVVKKEDEDSAYIMKNKTEDFIRHNNTDFVAKQDCKGIECAIENVFEDSNSDCNKDFIVKQKYKESEGVEENNTEDLVITQTVQNVDVDDSSRNNDSEYVVKQRGNDCEEESRKDNDSELVIKQGGEDTEDSRKDDKTISVITETDGSSGYIKENDSEDCTRDGDTNENYRRHGKTELLDKHIFPDIKHILNNNIEDSKRDHGTALLIKQRSEDTECVLQSQDSKTDSDIKLMIKQTYEETDCVMRIRSENCQKDDTEHVGKGTKYVIEKCIGDYERDGGNKFVINCRDENTECDMMNDSEDCRNDDTECVVKQGSGDAQYVSENYNEDSRNDDDKELVCKQTSVDIDIVLEKGISNSRRNGDMKHLVKQDVKDTVYVMANDSDNSGKNDRKIVKHQSEDTIYVMANESTDFRMDTDTQIVYKQRIEGTEYIMHNIIDNSRTSSDTHFVTDNKIEDSGRCGNTYFVPEYCVQSDSENSRTGNGEIFMNQEGENSEFITEHESEGSSKEYVTQNYNEEFKRNCNTQCVTKKDSEISEYETNNNNEDSRNCVKELVVKQTDNNTECADKNTECADTNIEYCMENDTEDFKRNSNAELEAKLECEYTEHVMENISADTRRHEVTELEAKQNIEDNGYSIKNISYDSRIDGDTNHLVKQGCENTENVENYSEDFRIDNYTETVTSKRCGNIEYFREIGSIHTRRYDGVECDVKPGREGNESEYRIGDSERYINADCMVQQKSTDLEYAIVNSSDDSRIIATSFLSLNKKGNGIEYTMDYNGKDILKDVEYFMANVSEDSTKFDDTEDIFKQDNADDEYMMSNDCEDSTRFDDIEGVFKQDNEDSEYIMANVGKDSARCDDTECVFMQDNEDSEYIMANAGEDSTRCDDLEGVFKQDNEDVEYIMANVGEDAARFDVIEGCCDETEGVVKLENRNAVANVGEDSTKCDGTEIVFKQDNEDAEYMMANVGKGSTRCVDTEGVVRQDNEDAEYMMANVDENSTAYDKTEGVFKLENQDAEYGMANVGEDSTRFDVIEGVFKQDNEDSEYVMANVGEDSTKCVDSEGVFKQDNEDADYVMVNVGDDSTRYDDTEYVVKLETENDEYVMENILEDCTKCDDTEIMVIPGGEDTAFVTEDGIEDSKSKSDSKLVIKQRNEHTEYVVGNYREDSKRDNDAKLVFRQSWLENNFKIVGTGNNDQYNVHNMHNLDNTENIDQLPTDTLSGGKFYHEVDIRNNCVVNKQSSNYTPTSETFNGQVNREMMSSKVPQSANKIDEPEDIPGSQFQDSACAKHKYTPCVVKFDILSVNTDLDMTNKVSSDIIANTRSDLVLRRPSIAGPKVFPEDVVGKQFKAEQIVACSPFTSRRLGVQISTSISEESATISEADLLSEYDLLETSSRDQLESLKLVVLEDEKYKAEIDNLISVNSESRDALNKSVIVDVSIHTQQQQEYKQNRQTKELEKDEVILQRRQLMKISSEIQSSNIEQNRVHLEGKWQHLKDILDARSEDTWQLQMTQLNDLERCSDQVDTARTVIESRVPSIPVACESIEVADITIFNSEINRYFQSGSPKFCWLKNVNATYQMEKRPVKSLTVIQKSCSTSRDMNSSSITTRSSDQSSESSFLLGMRSPALSLDTNTSPLSYNIFSAQASRKSTTQRIRDGIDGQATAGHDIKKSSNIEVLLHQLVESLDSCDIKLTSLESALSANGDMEQKIHCYIKCKSAVNQVERQDQLIKNETSFTSVESIDTQVIILLRRWENLKRLALQQDFRLCEDKYDHIRFANEIDNILAWLLEAEALQSLHQSLPSDISQLDAIVRQFKDFKFQLEFKKVRVLFINLLSEKYLEEKTAESMLLHNKLDKMNSDWQLVLSRAKHTEKNLQVSLIQCQEFHHRMHDYQLWLENIETCIHTCEPVNLHLNDLVRKKYVRLLDLSDELQHSQLQLMSLRHTADQVLMSTDSLEVSRARSKVHSLHSHMQTLVGLISSYSSTLEKTLQTSSNRGSTLVSGVVPPVFQSRAQENNLNTEPETALTELRYSKQGVHSVLLMRVIRATLPIYLMFMLLFLLFCLLPVCENEYECMFGSNFRHSISPVLHFTDGAPPT